MTMGGIRAVLFDMDGTVLDTERIYHNAWICAEKELGLDLPERLFNGSVGMNADDMELFFLKELGNPEIFPPLHRATLKYARESTLKGVPVKKGFAEFSDFLAESGVKTAIVTSTQTEEAVCCLKATGIYGRFNSVVGFGDTKKGKPAPEPYLEAMKRLRVTKDECLAFEDSPNGIRSATGAGIRTIFIKDLAEPSAEVLQTVFARLESLDEGIEIIKNLQNVQKNRKGEKIYAAH